MKKLTVFLFAAFPVFVFSQEEKKIPTLDSLKGILKTANDSNRIELLKEISNIYKFANIDSGWVYLKKFLEETQKQKNKKEEARCYMMYAGYFGGNSEKTNEYYLKALKIREEIQDTAGIGNCYIGLGRIYNSQKEYQKAFDVLTKAVEILKNGIGNENSLALANMDLGGTYLALGDTVKCFACEYEAVRIRQKIKGGSWYTFISQFTIAQMFAGIHQYDSVKVYLDMFENNKDSTYEVPKDWLNSLYSKYYSGIDEHDKAIFYAKQNFNDKIPDAFLLFAYVYEKAGMYSEAIPYFIRYDELKDSLSNTQESKNIATAQSQFENEKKDREIDLLNVDNEKQQLVLYAYSGGGIMMAVFIIFVFRSFSQNKKTNYALGETKKVIAEKNKEITDSINYAQRIQDAMLPAKEIKFKLFPDAFVLFEPRDVVSGDFYWFGERNRKRIIAAVDCTGHGVPGAFMSMIGNSFLNEIILEKGITSPEKVLETLREKIIEALKQKGETGENKDGMDITLCVFDDEKKCVEFSGANNPLYIIRNNELIETKGDKQPVGITFGELQPFTKHTIELQKNDCLYLFSDGYADQFGGPEKKKFKTKRLKEFLLSVHDKSMSEQEKLLLNNFTNWKGELEQIDDVLVIGIRI